MKIKLFRFVAITESLPDFEKRINAGIKSMWDEGYAVRDVKFAGAADGFVVLLTLVLVED